MRSIYLVSLGLAIIGALNWGLVGLFGVDLVAMLFGEMTTLSRLVYALVGLGGIGLIATACNMRKAMCTPQYKSV